MRVAGDLFNGWSQGSGLQDIDGRDFRIVDHLRTAAAGHYAGALAADESVAYDVAYALSRGRTLPEPLIAWQWQPSVSMAPVN